MAFIIMVHRDKGIMGCSSAPVKGAEYATLDAAQKAADELTARLSPMRRTGGYTPSGKNVARVKYDCAWRY